MSLLIGAIAAVVWVLFGIVLALLARTLWKPVRDLSTPAVLGLSVACTLIGGLTGHLLGRPPITRIEPGSFLGAALGGLFWFAMLALSTLHPRSRRRFASPTA